MARRPNPPSYQTRSIPPAITGLNARDAMSAMLPTDAVVLDNWDVGPNGPKPRKGFSQWCDGLGDAVEYIAEWRGPTSTKLISAANGHIWDCTTFDSPSSLASSKTSDRWQSVIFGGRLLMFNGSDAPVDYDGSAIAATSWSGSGLTIANLIQASVYSSRVWAVEKNTLNAWYGATGAITGAMTKFALSQVVARGGSLSFITSWTHDTGAGSAEFVVFVTDAGEVLVYAGDPASTFTLTNRFVVGEPLSRRAHCKVGGDTIILTKNGWTPLSVLLSTGLQLEKTSLSDKIVNLQKDLGQLHAGKFGWEAIFYKAPARIIVNVPFYEGTQQRQLVYHTSTGAWSSYSGINVNCMCEFAGRLYGGTPDGRVLLLDDILSDEGANITPSLAMAFTDLGFPGLYKLVCLMRPILSSDSAISFSMRANADYQVLDPMGVLTSSGGVRFTWDDLTSWGVWTAWNTAAGARVAAYGGGGAGYTISPALDMAVNNIDVTLIGFDIGFRVGGPL